MKLLFKPKTATGLTLVLLIGIAMVILMPFAVIWAVNTLFNTNIPSTFDTWLAVILLGMFFNNTGVSKS